MFADRRAADFQAETQAALGLADDSFVVLACQLHPPSVGSQSGENPKHHNPSAHGSHVASEGGRAGNQMKRQQQCKTTAHSICLPGLGVWPARLLVWMFQLHLDQSRAVYRLGWWVFIGPSRWGCPPWCYCRSVATAKHYETMGSNVPAMHWTVHSSLRWLPAGIWSHCGGRPVGSRARRCGGQSCCLPNLARSWGS